MRSSTTGSISFDTALAYADGGRVPLQITVPRTLHLTLAGRARTLHNPGHLLFPKRWLHAGHGAGLHQELRVILTWQSSLSPVQRKQSESSVVPEMLERASTYWILAIPPMANDRR